MRTCISHMKNHELETRRAKYVAASIVHLPNFEDYHKERFEVVKLSLLSMRKHLGLDAEILVWDNGSCEEFRKWVREEYKPTYFVEGRNIGKTSAKSAIIRMFHPDTVIGVSDDDMFFYPNWFKETLKLLEHYPNVGVVSGYPVRTGFRWGIQNTLAWARRQVKADHYNTLEIGRFISEEYDRDFCDSIGRSYEDQKRNTFDVAEVRMVYKGIPAYLTGHHCQFIGYAGRLLPFCTWDKYGMVDERPWDIAIDNAGLLRLTTTTRYTRHIGNVLDDSVRKAAREHGFEC